MKAEHSKKKKKIVWVEMRDDYVETSVIEHEPFWV